MTGTSSGTPYIYYCISSYYWNTYKARCNANIDIPAGFEFEYFGTTYDGDDSNDRIQLSRQGSMYFIDNGNTNVERNLWTYHQPELPYSEAAWLAQVPSLRSGLATTSTTATSPAAEIVLFTTV